MSKENLGVGEKLGTEILKAENSKSEIRNPKLKPEGELSIIHVDANGGIISWADITLKPGERLEIRRNVAG